MPYKNLLPLGIALLGCFAAPSSIADTADTAKQLEHGAYLYKIAGCGNCHSDPDRSDALPVGGRKMETPFGNFFTPNITPDKDTGIGGWSERQFIQAVKQGLSPAGEHYYPAFPYTSYTKMSDSELVDLKAYLDSVAAVRNPNRDHELNFPFNQRWILAAWKGMFFEEGEFKNRPFKSESWNRGAYIVSGPGHCVECHSPRNLLGGLDTDALLTGNPAGPDGEKVPAIHAARNSSFDSWDWEDIHFALETGVGPDGSVIGGAMADVIDNSTSQLSPEDLKAVADYLAHPL